MVTQLYCISVVWLTTTFESIGGTYGRTKRTNSLGDGFGCGFGVSAAALAGHRPVWAESPSLLKDAYKSDFLMGVALGGSSSRRLHGGRVGAIKSQFNAVTPENCMKPGSIHPAKIGGILPKPMRW